MNEWLQSNWLVSFATVTGNRAGPPGTGNQLCYSEISTCASARQRSSCSAYLPASGGGPGSQLSYAGSGELRGVASGRGARRMRSGRPGTAVIRADGVFPTRNPRTGQPGRLRIDSLAIRAGRPITGAGVALDYFAEVTEQMLPAAEPNEKFFRLLLAVLDICELPPGRCVAGRRLLSLWAVRPSGWLPELHVCLSCGSLLDDPRRTLPSARFSAATGRA